MANAWFVVAPAGESQGSFTSPTVPDNSRIAEVSTGSAAYTAWLNNGSYDGWQVVMGPFTSAAQAKAAHPPAGLSAVIVAVGLGADVALQSALGSGPALPGPAISNPLAAVGDFLARLEKPATWLRVAEAIAGFLLVALGINALLHNPAGKAIQTVRP